MSKVELTGHGTLVITALNTPNIDVSVAKVAIGSILTLQRLNAFCSEQGSPITPELERLLVEAIKFYLFMYYKVSYERSKASFLMKISIPKIICTSIASFRPSHIQEKPKLSYSGIHDVPAVFYELA